MEYIKKKRYQIRDLKNVKGIALRDGEGEISI